MGALNTEVFGDPGSCRESGRWLGELANGVGETADRVHQVRSRSEECWAGQAGDAFRGELTKNGKSTDEFHQVTKKAGDSLQTFAAELDAVRERMHQARERAQGAGLAVTATEIQPPGPAPGASPQAPQRQVSPEASKQHGEAMAAHAAAARAHQDKVRAFDEASGAVADARRLERGTHERLTAAMDEYTSATEYLKKNGGWFAAATVASAVGSLHGAALKLKDRADAHSTAKTAAAAIADDPSKTPAERAQSRIDALRHSARETIATSTRNSNSGKLLGLNERKYGKPAFDQFTKYPGEKTLGNSSKLLARGANAVAAKIPYIGAGISATSAGVAMAGGADKSETILTTSTNYAVGALATAGTIALIGSGGWAVLGAVAAGTVVSAGVGWGIENSGAKDFFRDVF